MKALIIIRAQICARVNSGNCHDTWTTSKSLCGQTRLGLLSYLQKAGSDVEIVDYLKTTTWAIDTLAAAMKHVYVWRHLHLCVHVRQLLKLQKKSKETENNKTIKTLGNNAGNDNEVWHSPETMTSAMEMSTSWGNCHATCISPGLACTLMSTRPATAKLTTAMPIPAWEKREHTDTYGATQQQRAQKERQEEYKRRSSSE